MKLFFLRGAVCRLALAAGLTVAGTSSAQISFGPSGAGPLTFDTVPPASQWSTRSVPPSSATAVQDQTQLDALVQTNTAAIITAALTTSTFNPPAASGVAVWSTNGFVQTRPTGNSATLLLATLRNDSGATQSAVYVSYDLFVTAPTPEQVPGASVYFSLTGQPGSWQSLPAISGTNQPWQGRTELLALNSWEPNAPLYVLWADDNGSGTPDTALQFDNVLFAPAAPSIAVPPQNTSVAPGGTAVFTVRANGAPPLFYQWLKAGEPVPDATNDTFSVANAQPSDQGVYSIIVSNAYGIVESSGAFLAVACSAPVMFTKQPQNQSLLSGGTIMLSVEATGTATIGFQWHRNDVPLAGATNRILTVSNAMAGDSGRYFVVASNCSGTLASSTALVGVADVGYTVVALTNHLWRYDQSGANLGTQWSAEIYGDSSWPEGRGLFALEDNPLVAAQTNTALSLTDGGGNRIITYYFRTTFTLTNDPGDIRLVTTNYFDDGAIVYMNGAEAVRYNMPAGAVSYTTLANAANPAGEGVFVVSNVPSSLLRQGTNVVAVEVHQNSGTSSDVAFGMGLIVVPLPPTPLAITNQPVDLVTEPGHAALFTAGVSGNTGRFQWLKDGVPIADATAMSLVLSNVSFADSGAYVLEASNAFGIVYSRVATLTVRRDGVPPVLVAADMLDSTRVLASFSEPVDALTAANPANYSVTNTAGGSVSIFSATLTNQTNLLLRTSPLADEVNFVLTERGVTDTAPEHNASPGSAVPVARQVQVIAFDRAWDFFDPYPPFDDPDPGPTWREPGHDTSMWGSGPGAFGYLADNSTAPVPINTAMSPSPAVTAYFRAPLWSSLSPAGLTLSLRAAADDGAAVYCNSREIYRVNLPPGAPAPQTTSTSSVAIPTLSASVPVPGDVLQPGPNLFAAELHQWAASDPDKYFALELTAHAESLLTPPLLVLGGPADLTVTEGAPAEMRVTAIAASQFQWQVNGADLFGATNAVLVIPAVPLAFDGAQVRCLCSDGNTSLFSTSATLHVIADTTPPVLLSAIATSSNTLVVSFSEPMAAPTATNLANYQLTNANGTALVIVDAILRDGTNVVLSLTSPLAGTYLLAVQNVTDAAANANVIAPGSAATIGGRVFVAMDSAWRYLLINTNEQVHQTFMLPTLDDSAWLGPSNALFYNESAALPGPKNTPLPLTAPTGERINTYYFRQWFTAVSGHSNVVLRVRHIIDDGMVLHLNGQEIYRFNMLEGPLTAASQAATAIGDGTLVGPIPVPAQLWPGTNLLAASVHQSGSSSVDVVFGVEVTVEIPSEPRPLPMPAPRLGLVSFGNRFALQWDAPDYTLEGAENVNGPWTAISTTSPTFVPRTNATAFYRLRQ